MASPDATQIPTPSRNSTDADILDARAELLTVQEAAKFVKVPVSWVYEHVRPDIDDRQPVMKTGKYLRFDPRDLHAYIDAKRAASRRQPHRR